MNDTYLIRGCHPLQGQIRVQGAKNSVLPILSACLLSSGICTVRNCPALSDVDAALMVLRHLGCSVCQSDSTVTVNSSSLTSCCVSAPLMHKMRSSIIFLGAILARTGQAHVALPGGCELGERPIDLHLAAFRQMGAEITGDGHSINCRCACLKGADIHLSFPSVGATENIMIAAALAKGITRIYGAAREPEIVDLQSFLTGMGARIQGAGTNTVIIEGVPSLGGTAHTVMPDRIAAVTYLCCAVSAGGHICLTGVEAQHFGAVTRVFEKAGCQLNIRGKELTFSAPERLCSGGRISTRPYPGFPTDAQAPVMAALLKSEGMTVFEEHIFENRFRHVPQLCRLGADIALNGKTAAVTGVPRLTGSTLRSTDLRGGAGLVVAALGAEGESTVTQLSHIDRGYEHFDAMLRLLGADICRV